MRPDQQHPDFTRRIALTWMATLSLASIGQSQLVGPVVPGLQQRHPLEEREVGELLLGELGCAVCHPSPIDHRPAPKQAPDLAQVGARVSAEYLKSFIEAPAMVHPGTTMPGLLQGETPARRKEIAEAITHFLVTRSEVPFRTQALAREDLTPGRSLYHRVGCVVCHGIRQGRDELDGDTPGAATTRRLDHVSEKYSLESLASFLFQPSTVRPSGRMPDLGLSKAEARSIATFLLEGAPDRRPAFSVDKSLAEEGRRQFEALSCNACHQLEGVPERKSATPLDQLNPARGCLAQVPDGVPDFHLDPGQREALGLALARRGSPASPAEEIALSLTAFNCIACHGRDGYGGVSPDFDAFFTTDQPDLGDDARIPPSLTLAGAKLRPSWLRRVLFDGQSVRPYMMTRMPQFGQANLDHLPALLEDADQLPPVDLAVYERDQQKLAREAGTRMLGDDGLNCISCHMFNDKPSPGFQGIDLINSYERLEYNWFRSFLIRPTQHRPNIVMPEYWPGGQAVHTEILEGDTEAQLQAIWHVFSLGRSARDPSGIRAKPSRLEVTDSIRTYRGRSGIAGYRGIAVGYPGELNYAFDANNGTLCGLWRGDYVSVRWDGQGAGGFNPAARAIRLAPDVSFYRLEDAREPWPLLPVMTEEQPVNPDPLYPRNRGYSFGGYDLDEDSNPTFHYRSGEIAISDSSVADYSGEHPTLVRTLQLVAPVSETLYFRALVGEIQARGESVFARDDLRLEVPPVKTHLRPVGEDGKSSELLLQIAVPAGEFSLTLRYQLLH